MILMTDDEFFERLRAILKAGWHPVPNNIWDSVGSQRKDDVPNRLLRELLGLPPPSSVVPNPGGGKWNVRFHSTNSLFTLFHKEGEPRGHLREMLAQFGYTREDDERVRFRHTIEGKSSVGSGYDFVVANEDDERVTVRQESAPEKVWASWPHDILFNKFAPGYQNLIVVEGRRRNRGREVLFESAHAYSEPRTSLLFIAIESGIIAIEFDVTTVPGKKGLRNRGTKFRIARENLRHLYREHRPV